MMRLWPSRAVCCPADTTLESAAIDTVRGRPARQRRAKMIFHVGPGSVRCWHWSDDRVIPASDAARIHDGRGVAA